MKCIIVGAGNFKENEIITEKNDLIIAVDGGYNYCRLLNLEVDILIGDMDSLEIIPDNIIKHVYNKEKDETDTYLAVHYGIDQGYTDFILYGCLGGRIEHTIANIQIIADLCKKGIKIKIVDENTNIYMINKNEVIEIEGLKKKYISIFSYSEKSTISLKGFKYNVVSKDIKNDYPLGIDNETIGTNGNIYVHNGLVLVIERLIN